MISVLPGYAADCKGVFGCDAKYGAPELLVSYGFELAAMWQGKWRKMELGTRLNPLLDQLNQVAPACD